jgi:hypothetical protein
VTGGNTNRYTITDLSVNHEEQDGGNADDEAACPEALDHHDQITMKPRPHVRKRMSCELGPTTLKAKCFSSS